MGSVGVTFKQFGNALQNLIPKLSFENYKGCFGKVCVIGGSYLYTGAVFFSAISSLRLGADLTYVICPESASAVIKSYSPELMVLPYLNRREHQTEIVELINKCHSIVIGPGLGRKGVDLFLLRTILSTCLENKKNLVLDADILWMLLNDSHLMHILNGTCAEVRYNVILTPNKIECQRLFHHFELEECDVDSIKKLANLTKCNVILKGNRDLFSNGREIYDLTALDEQCPKRCGGQGDILAGCLATCLLWSSTNSPSENYSLNPSIVATNFVKYLALNTFDSMGISMTATDMISHIPQNFQHLLKNCD